MDLFTGQVLPISFKFAPKFTAFTQGQTLPINQNQALFALLGTTYGGNGQPGGTFGLPDTRGRSVTGFNVQSSFTPIVALGSNGGETSHALVTGEMPVHMHTMYASSQGTSGGSPADALPGATTSSDQVYGAATALLPLGAAPFTNVGGGQPHANMQPSLPINYVIVLVGIYPTRN